MVAPYADLRYFIPVFGPLYILIGLCLEYIGNSIIKATKKPLGGIFTVVCSVLIIGMSYIGLLDTPPLYLYPMEENKTIILEQHTNTPCVLIADYAWKQAAIYSELIQFEDIYIADTREEGFVEKIKNDPLLKENGYVLFLQMSGKDMENEMLSLLQKKVDKEIPDEVFPIAYGHAYLLE